MNTSSNQPAKSTASSVQNNTYASPRSSSIRNIHVFDLMRYRLPLPAWVSILHRVSGLLLILSLPFLLMLLLSLSLTSQISFDELTFYWLAKPWVRLVLSLLLWSYLHHFCAGIRFLLLDLHCGVDKKSANRSAVWVLLISLALTVVLCARLWSMF